VRKLGRTSPLTFEAFRAFVETRPAEVVANMAICLVHQATFLLDRQLKALEKGFVEGGGLRERMTRTPGSAGAPAGGRVKPTPNPGAAHVPFYSDAAEGAAVSCPSAPVAIWVARSRCSGSQRESRSRQLITFSPRSTPT